MQHATQAKLQVLVVDDEPRELDAIEKVLSDDYRVLKTTSPAQALQLLEVTRDIAVLLTDQCMPAMTGDELIATLDDSCATQRILVTGYADLEAAMRAVNTGKLFAYVAKPWEPRDLRDKVDRAAREYREARQLTAECQLLHDLLDHAYGRPPSSSRWSAQERVRAANALAMSESLLRKQTDMLNAILQGLAEGVVVTDAHGHFLLCNAEAERILDVGANALSVANWASVCQLYDADDESPLRAEVDPIARAIGGTDLAESELCVRRSDGRRLRVSLSATPLRNEFGAIVGGIGLLCDVTEQRAIEQRLRQAQKMDAIGRLAGGVAHDFNNLLAVIQSCGELMLRELSPRDPMRAELGQILNASQRAALLTKQLLSFSRKQIVQPKTLQLNDVVRHIDGLLRRVIGEHIEIITELAPDLGSVSIDSNQLEQIILNLAVNARDAMPHGGELRITTRNFSTRGLDDNPPAGDWVVLTIRDTGTGMAAETQRRMFEPFYTTKEVGKGSGLGLSTVYGIVEQNAGFIRCETAPNRGAAFEIYLKRVDRVPLAESQARAANGATSGAILLVDDEDSVRRVAAAILRKHGHTVLEARRPSDAVEVCALANRPIDLLLTDVVTSESSGPQLAATLRELQPSMGVMYTSSGYSVDESALRRAARRDGATFLQKPFTPAVLIDAVSEALSRQSA